MRKTIEVGLITAILVSLAISVCWLGPMRVRQQTQVWEHAEDGTLVCVSPEPTFTDLVHTLPDAVEATLDSCVHVVNVTQGWQGSAVAITPDILVTARHVNEGGREFLITTVDGNEYTATQAISSKKYDIGFIKLDEPVLTPVATGSLDALRLGESVYVIGGSLGKMNWPNITAGIVSCLNRDVEAYRVPKDFGWSVLWQVDAATYPGNSGGPIFSLDGVVRGILVGGIIGEECLSYCVPLSTAMPDITVVRMLFIADEYQVEEIPVYDDDNYGEFYNREEDNDYYILGGE